MLVGPADVNPVFASVFGNAVSIRDIGLIVIQLNDAYVTGDRSLTVWGVANSRVIGTAVTANWINASGLPDQPQRFEY